MMNVRDNTRMFEGFIATILLTVASVEGKDGCKVMDFLPCEKNKTLTGHVIKSFRMSTPGLDTCQHECYLEDKCVSYNMGPVLGMIRSCELNDADHWIRPGHVVSKIGSEYCPIKNPCSSCPCPSGRVCRPDLSWDTFQCDDARWTQWTPWTACHLPFCPMTRTRKCTEPAPQDNGNCTGPGVETKECRITAVDTRGCENPLGMEDRNILDTQITASSIASDHPHHAPQGGRLNNQPVAGDTIGAWAADRSVGVYIQIDLGNVKVVTKIATQGRPTNNNQWVTEYSVSYSNDTTSWTNYQGDCVKKFPGNVDKETVVTNKFDVPIIAQHIRVIVQNWYGNPTMRMELYGCNRP